jgi:Family of unknown function (DUF5764)
MDMDDFIPQTLNESLNEWCARLVNILTPRVIENLWKLLEEARRTAMDAKQLDKYLLSFQQLLQFVPKWSIAQVEEVRKHIIQKSGCNHLEELITCAHIILTKALVCARPGNRQKQLNVSIPKIDVFIHKVFIKSAGHAYRNAYLFEKEVAKLQYQRNMHDLEKLVHRAILDVIRENIPEEEIIRAFLDENYEYEEETIIENIPDESMEEKREESNTKKEDILTGGAMENIGEKEEMPYIQDVSNEPVVTRLETNEDSIVLPSFSSVSSTNNTGLEVVKSNIGDEMETKLETVDLDYFQPKTTQQLAEQSSAMDFIKTKEETSEQFKTEDFSNLLDVFDLGAEEDKMKSLGAVEHIKDTSDFMLDIQDIS